MSSAMQPVDTCTVLQLQQYMQNKGIACSQHYAQDWVQYCIRCCSTTAAQLSIFPLPRLGDRGSVE